MQQFAFKHLPVHSTSQEPQICSIVSLGVVMGRQGQAVGLLVGTLIHGQERVEEELRQAILTSLAAVAADDPGRLAIHEAGGVPLLIKLMNDGSPEAVCSALLFILQCTSRLAASESILFSTNRTRRHSTFASVNPEDIRI